MTHYRFETHCRQSGPNRGQMMCAGKPSLELAVPPEFGGPESVLTPEDLFLAALDSCVMLSFGFQARRAGLEIVDYRSRAVGHLEKQPDGLRFAKVELFVQVEVDSNPEGALKALHEAHKECPVARATACPVELHPQVWTRATAPVVD